MTTASNTPDTSNEIAVIGMAGRFPGAANVDEFWLNLSNGVESVSIFTEEELESSGVSRSLLVHPGYVRAKGILSDIDLFDASFFGFNPREAEVMDPQHRIFLECASEALENAGCNPDLYAGSIGVYAGVAMSTYYWNNLSANEDLLERVGAFQLAICNDKDFLPTRVSYKLNLKGPSLSVQSACSTSLVAVHLACQSLLNGECDVALGGGASVTLPWRAGYLYQAGGISSPDGHCRPFDSSAGGTVIGNGVGIVVLKRLADAIDDGDNIHAVIRGSAINNDGAIKIGFTAPSVDGQAAVIIEAQSVAAIDAGTISYVESHGTGTALGDPIEVAALTKAFRAATSAKASCALGAVKSNIGHLDAAAGVTGLIKTILALKNRALPPTLHFSRPNPEIDFANSPFYVNTELKPWTSKSPLRAGVSSFGIGGTNAHVIVEEAPEPGPSDDWRLWQLLVVSAKTSTALNEMSARLARHLTERGDLSIADVAYTLQTGRRLFNHRRAILCTSPGDAVSILEGHDAKRVFTGVQEGRGRPVIFMFSGQGSQYVNMARGLYETERSFRSNVDYCCELLAPGLGLDLRTLCYPDTEDSERSAQLLQETWVTQPALFVVEYALARLWTDWGLRPRSMIGHSIGEYVAACLSGVLSLDDALNLVAERGRLMHGLPRGAMLAVTLAEDEARKLTENGLSIAAVNAPGSCVLSGPTGAIEELQAELEAKQIACRRLNTSHAFHSAGMDGIIDEFTAKMRKITLNPPTIPFVSNLTGDWITDAEATSPGYWAKHMRHAVRFADGIQRLIESGEGILLEVGPGKQLSSLAKQQVGRNPNFVVLSSTRHPDQQEYDSAFTQGALGRLWLAGASIDWQAVHSGARRRRIELPTYPFERQRYWIEGRGEGTHRKVDGNATHLPDDSTISGGPDLVPETADDAGPGALRSAHARPEMGTEYEAPRDELERAVASIWQEMLGIDRVGVHDDFFELGGHSLLATQVVSRLRDSFAIELSVRSLFEAPSVAELALIIADVRQLDGDKLPQIKPVSRTGDLPLSFAQQRLWFLDQLEGNASFYNMPGALRLTGALNLCALERCFNEIVRRHEVLRTTFVARDGAAVQAIQLPAEVALPIVDLSAVPEQDRQELLQGIMREEAQRAFDLKRDLLLRVTLVQLSEQDYVCLFTFHHIASDAWSNGIAVRELVSLYEAFCNGRTSPLPELPIQYADYAAWQRELMKGTSLEEQLTYWRAKLAGSLPLLKLPLDRPRPPIQSYRGERYAFRFSPELSQSIRGLARKEEVTLFMVLLTAFKALLHKYTRAEDLLVGTAIAGRNRSEIEGLIGPFINNLVIRTEISGNPRFTDLLSRVKEAVLGAFANQDLPFDKLVEDLRPDRDLSYSPLVQVAFGILNAPANDLHLSGLTVKPVDLELETARLDLTVWMVDEPEGLTGVWSYAKDLFDRSTMQTMSTAFESLLSSIVRNPAGRLSALETLTESEKELKALEELDWEETSARQIVGFRRRPVSLDHAG